MAANDFAAQNGTEKMSTNALTTVNGTNVATDLIEVQRTKVGWGPDGVLNDVTTSAPLPVTQPDITASGTMLLVNDTVPITISGDGAWSIDLSGFAGHVVTFESQVNSGTPWRAINGALQGVGSLSSLASADGIYRGAAAALAGIRARLSTIGTGMVTASLRASVSSAGVFQMSPTPAGTNLIGYVEGTAGALLARDGTDITTPTAMPAGGAGIRGWLSAIWTKLNGILSVVITSNGLISTLNSSSTPLGIGGVLTGTSEDVTEWGEARVSVFADQAGATDGLQMQQSSNGTNWDVIDSYTIPASTGKTFSIALSLKHFRVVNTNGGVAQGVLRLQTKYFKNYNKASSVRPQDARTNDNDFEELLTHLMGYDSAAANWNRLRATIANGLAVDVTRLPALVAGSAIAGKFGIDQTTPQSTNQVTIQASTLAATVTAAANTAATLTLPAPGAGLFHYITGLEISRTATAALTGNATLVTTTTNLPGSLAWSFGNAMTAGGTQKDLTLAFDNPLKSSVANTASTIAMPAAGAAVLWRANVYYYTAP